MGSAGHPQSTSHHDSAPGIGGSTPLAPTIPNNSGEGRWHRVGEAMSGVLARSPLLGRAPRRTCGHGRAHSLSLLHLLAQRVQACNAVHRALCQRALGRSLGVAVTTSFTLSRLRQLSRVHPSASSYHHCLLQRTFTSMPPPPCREYIERGHEKSRGPVCEGLVRLPASGWTCRRSGHAAASEGDRQEAAEDRQETDR
jgi:hypothetical protein